MTAIVYITEYACFGGRKPGGEDDSPGFMPQIPGRILQMKELDASGAGLSHSFHQDTTFIKAVCAGGPVHFNFDDAGVASLIADNREYLHEGIQGFQGTRHGKSGVVRYSKINVIDAP